MRKILLTSAALLVLGGAAHAQSCCVATVTNCGNCGYIYSSTTDRVISVQPDESTLAAWAAKKAVESQLDWLGEDKAIEKYDRAEVDRLQARVDALCKWAKTLSNHIFAKAYQNWADQATEKLNARRASLDKLDVAKSLVTGLPVPPEGK